MDASGPASQLKRAAPWHAAFAAFALGLFLFLAVRASNPDRLSDWGFGDVQTMLSLRHWNEAGWLANHLLFVPQGYAKVVKHLDKPGLRQHAHGISPPAEGSGVGPRLRYTHYPAGYLVPYAALYRLGFDSLFAARVLSCLYSVAALCLAYGLFTRLTTPPVALVSALFYGLSPLFLSYADSLANQPTDDLLRWAFLLAIALATGASTPKREKAFLGAAWGLEFLLSLSSFDSVFFVYVWLVGWDAINGLGFRWRRYLLFGLAPLTAHGLQFAQNIWYLGFHDAAEDITATFLAKAGGSSLGFRLSEIATALKTLPLSAQWKPNLLLACAALYAVHRVLFRSKENSGLPSLRVLFLLTICGLAYAAVLPYGAHMPYQGRQFLPALALLVGAATAIPLKVGASLFRQRRENSLGKTLMTALYATAGSLFLVPFWAQFAAADRSSHGVIYEEDSLRAKVLRSVATEYEPVFFAVNAFDFLYDPDYVPGYPQVSMFTEYDIGSRPVLCFDTPELLVKDLVELARRSEDRFSPIVISRDRNVLPEVFIRLGDAHLLSSIPSGFSAARDVYWVDLTAFLDWRALGRK